MLPILVYFYSLVDIYIAIPELQGIVQHSMSGFSSVTLAAHGWGYPAVPHHQAGPKWELTAQVAGSKKYR